MNLEKLHRIYFIGIGGIGMSALARYFSIKGIQINGYDKTPTKLTNQLQSEGIGIHFEDDIKLIPPDVDLVIYTPAIPKELNIFRHLEKSGIPMKKRAEILGILTKNKKTIAVAGTHGKTTVSALIAHVINLSNLGCTAFLGGISKNHKSNLIVSDKSNWTVVEADEYDKSFLQLFPDMGIITSVDADHLDIYGNHENIKTSFLQFASHIKMQGNLIVKKGIGLNHDHLKNRTISEYSGTAKSNFYATNIRIENGKYIFDFVLPERTLFDVVSGLPGEYNVENAVAAMTAAHLAGVDDRTLYSGVATFLGIERRFDIQYKSDSTIFIDDYAHHPEEIKATVISVKKMFPNRKILGIFQPHLFSRTRDFADEFAQSLELLDEIILLPIYAAREKPIQGVSSEILLEKIQKTEKMICSGDDLLHQLTGKTFDILITLGAGDIEQLVNPIKDYLNNTR